MSLNKPRAPLVPKPTLEDCIKDWMDKVGMVGLNFLVGSVFYGH
jgi:hypothetical protein